jgi:hypothetical protein
MGKKYRSVFIMPPLVNKAAIGRLHFNDYFKNSRAKP